MTKCAIAKPDNTDKQHIQSLLLSGNYLYITQAKIPWVKLTIIDQITNIF